MNHLTPEQALSDLRAARRDRKDDHWFQCACVLADENERLTTIEARRADIFRRYETSLAGICLAIGITEQEVRSEKRGAELMAETIWRLTKDRPAHEECAKLRDELDEQKRLYAVMGKTLTEKECKLDDALEVLADEKRLTAKLRAELDAAKGWSGLP